jgi:salicylate hydroxylase
MTIFP